MESKLLLKFIIHNDTIVGKCICCNKPIKHEYYTNKGIYGKNCFFKAIGIKLNRKKIIELPQDQRESMMEELIRRFGEISSSHLLNFYMNFYGTEKIVVYQSDKVHFHIIIKDVLNNERKERFNILSCDHYHDFFSIVNVPMEYRNLLRSTRQYLQYSSLPNSKCYYKLM